MKPTFSSFLLVFALSFSLFGQNNLSMPQSPSAPSGTSLGANETIAYNGIALGNRVKMRGYVDFIYSYGDFDHHVLPGALSPYDGSGDDARFSTSADIDFLFDFSPVTGEVHLSSDIDRIELEQAFARYNFNQDFNLSFGRQLTNLGFEADEAPGLYAVSYGYFGDVIHEHELTKNFLSNIANGIGVSEDEILLKLRRKYVDGVKANFNNGMFGVSFGIHDGYWQRDDFNDNIAIDIAASAMIIPGLETRLGFAFQDNDSDSEISQFNTWVAYNPGDLTLALEFDYFDFDWGYDADLWNIMFLANYQFVDWFGATFRYSHEDGDDVLYAYDYSSDRFTLAFMFAISQNFAINLEFSHTELEIEDADGDVEEIYVEGLFQF